MLSAFFSTTPLLKGPTNIAPVNTVHSEVQVQTARGEEKKKPHISSGYVCR